MTFQAKVLLDRFYTGSLPRFPAWMEGTSMARYRYKARPYWAHARVQDRAGPDRLPLPAGFPYQTLMRPRLPYAQARSRHRQTDRGSSSGFGHLPTGILHSRRLKSRPSYAPRAPGGILSRIPDSNLQNPGHSPAEPGTPDALRFQNTSSYLKDSVLGIQSRSCFSAAYTCNTK